MTLPRPSRLAVLTAALVVLLPALAVLQYRWVGQLSDAERERMQRSLQHAARQFREGFEAEVSRALIGLRVDGAVAREDAWGRYAERYAAWVGTAAQPALVADVFLVDADGARVRLRRWNPRDARFDAAPWSGGLAGARDYFEAERAAFASKDGGPRPAPFRDDPSLIVSPLVHVRVGTGRAGDMLDPVLNVFGFTVIQLNLPFIRAELLPALARRHFPQAGGTGYHVAVVDATTPGTAIFRSSPEAPIDPARADVDEPLLSAHLEPLMLLAHAAPGTEVRERRNVVVSVIRERGDAGTVRARILGGDAARWRLLVRDERGSLDAAVGAVRRRNLAISFGILLLMAVSIGLLTLSSRRAHRLARQQIEFVAGVSHELRTPVAVIHSAAENLSHGVVDDPGRVRRYGEAIEAEARRLGEMVERVLQFAGIEAGRPMPRRPVAVAALVAEAVAAAEAAAPGIAVERRIAADLPAVAGDEAALRSAVQNLLANAAKYGGADRWIGVRAEAAPPGRAREVRITVEDRGPGIDAADLPHIFEPFYRGAAATARQIQGSGLGLALVRRIVDAHGGRVTVASRAREGAAFTIHLPVATGRPAPQSVEGASLSADEAAAR